MARMGSFSMSDMKHLQKELNKLRGEKAEAFLEECAKELAARLLAKVIKRTPVGDYSRYITVTAKRDSKHHKKGDKYRKQVNTSGKVGGTLRRGWTSKTHEEAASSQGNQTVSSASQYANSLEINHIGNNYVIDIINPVEYASCVEYGHRTTNHRRWVRGRFMLTLSEREIQKVSPKVLENKVKKFMKECFL